MSMTAAAPGSPSGTPPQGPPQAPPAEQFHEWSPDGKGFHVAPPGWPWEEQEVALPDGEKVRRAVLVGYRTPPAAAGQASAAPPPPPGP